MQILITYDVSQRHPEVKNGMINNGFFDSWKKNDVTYYLPNTTLWHPELLSPQTAIDIFKKVINQLNGNQPLKNIIKIERLIAVNFEVTSGDKGEPHS